MSIPWIKASMLLLWGIGLGWTVETSLEILPPSVYRSGIELHIGMPLMTKKITEGIEQDTAFHAEVIWRPPRAFPPRDFVNLHIGLGIAGGYQDGASADTAVELIHTTARYHLGADLDFSPNLRLALVPYIGLGVAYLGVDDARNLQAIDGVDLAWEAGVKASLEVTVGQMTIGGGVGFRHYRSSHDFLEGFGGTTLKVKQDVVEGFFVFGWTF